MAKRARSFLPPAEQLDATIISWGKGKQLHRVHEVVHAGNGFNPSSRGNARFSPLVDSEGRIVPTLYAGTTLDCALMETIFHDVPFVAGFKPLSIQRMAGKVHSVFTPNADLKLIDLSTIAMRRLGVNRAHLIDTTKWHYPETRVWAQRLYAQHREAQGLRWTSRQDDSAHAVMLFGTRVKPADLLNSGPSRLLLADGLALRAVIDLAMRLGVTLVD